MSSPPLTKHQIIDLYFIEHRAKLLDVASLLDRVDRAPSASGAAQVDPRVVAMIQAAAILGDGKPERARRILELMSDPTTVPIPKAGTKGAIGVWPDLASARKDDKTPASATIRSENSSHRRHEEAT